MRAVTTSTPDEQDTSRGECRPDLREEQPTETAEGSNSHDDATSGTDGVEADDLGRSRADEDQEQDVGSKIPCPPATRARALLIARCPFSAQRSHDESSAEGTDAA